MTDTINNGIPFVPENTIDPAAGLNLSLNTVDALLQVLVQSVGVNTPPAGVEGQRHIVGTAPTGPWAGQANRMARFLDGAYQFFDARYALNAADGRLYLRSGATWASLPLDGDISSAIAAHIAAPDPHTQYLTGTEADAAYAPIGHVGAGGAAHANAVASGAAGFMTGADKAKLDGVAAGATANATDAQLRDRSTHTGSQAISTVAGLQAALDGKLASTANAVSATKLATARTINGVAFDGTANITIGADWSNVANKPATYAPSAHTHAMTDISGLSAALDGQQSQVTDIEIRQWMGV